MKNRRRVNNKEKKQNQKAEMGGCVEWPQQNGFVPNGLLVEEVASITRPVDPVRWAIAEESTAELISRIQPNQLSEKRRNAVASYVQRLISSCVPCQVFTFGSVPLKTYLPDGDIDLTAFSEDQTLKSTWAKEVQNMLQKEEKNEHAEFSVKEVQLIEADVKLIKCLVDNIVVDISFNQLGGLCTLCFLEEVDNLVSQNHLFKRSIILIKAWCYYESRVLGAHHGLISTYALETLVLYIFHVFNNSFAGPLEVLYRFLEFFSKFDWANFCVSLWGPVPISSLPSIAAAPPRKDGGELLLSQKFLDSCAKAYSVVQAGPENRENPFMSKHLNIIDPLRLNNNLGRSVSKGNFYRIRSAFGLGAQQLAKILECPVEDVVPELNQFFVNTWDRHGNGCRPDAHRELELDEPHHSVDYLGQPNTFPFLSKTRTTDSQKDLTAPNQKGHDESRTHIASGVDHYHTERSNLWKKQRDDIKRTCRMNILQASGHTTHHFARTSSSPELTSMSVEAAPRRTVPTAKVGDDASSRPGYSRRMIDSVSRENHIANRFTDEPPIRESSSRHNLAFGPDHSFDSSVNKSVSGSTTPVDLSALESRQTCVEEQDFVKRLSSIGVQHLGGHAQMPVNLASHSFVQFPHSLMGYGHQNYAGPIPANMSALESDWSSMMNYPNGAFSAPFHQQFRPFGVITEQDKMIGGLSERAVSPEINHVDEHSGFWADRNDHSSRQIDPEIEDFSTASSRLSPASPSTSSRTKASSESSWDGKPAKMTSLSNFPVGKKASSTRNSVATINGKWEEDRQLVDHTCDDHKDWVHFPAQSVAQSITTSPVEVNQIPGFRPPQMNCETSISPFNSVLVHPGPNQGIHNHAMLPFAFYPPGSRVPIVTMLPVYGIPAEAGSSGAPTGHNNIEMGKPLYPINQSGCSSDPTHTQTDHYDLKNMIACGEHPDNRISDIFNSDFTNHWKNLQYGRHCQDPQMKHPYAYNPSVLVPPLPSPGTSSMISPGRSNTFAHVIPVPVPQSGAVKPAGVSGRYGGEVSKQRNGIGTYFPDPNMIKERPPFTSRQYRGDYGYDRNENHEDREANWNFNSKPRYNGRVQHRNYNEKQNTKIDRSATSISRSDRTCILCTMMKFFQLEMLFSLHRLVMLYPYHHLHPVDYGSWTEHLQFGSVQPEGLVGSQAQKFCGYPKGGAQELQNYQGDTRPPSPGYASSPRFLSGVGA